MKQLQQIASTLGRAAIAGATAALPVYATGQGFDDRALQVAFLGPLLGWLALTYNVSVSKAMGVTKP